MGRLFVWRLRTDCRNCELAQVHARSEKCVVPLFHKVSERRRFANFIGKICSLRQSFKGFRLICRNPFFLPFYPHTISIRKNNPPFPFLLRLYEG